MMQKKIDWSRDFIQKHQHLFACPYCHAAIEALDGYSLVCTNVIALISIKKALFI